MSKVNDEMNGIHSGGNRRQVVGSSSIKKICDPRISTFNWIKHLFNMETNHKEILTEFESTYDLTHDVNPDATPVNIVCCDGGGLKGEKKRKPCFSRFSKCLTSNASSVSFQTIETLVQDFCSLAKLTNCRVCITSNIRGHG